MWEGRFKSCVVDEDNYLLICQRYIELNPVRAGMVTNPEDYPWSSYRANALEERHKLGTPHPIYQSLGNTSRKRASVYRELFSEQLDSSQLEQVRNATNQGMALGNDRFKQEIERLSGRRVTPLKRGPKPQKSEEFLL